MTIRGRRRPNAEAQLRARVDAKNSTTYLDLRVALALARFVTLGRFAVFAVAPLAELPLERLAPFTILRPRAVFVVLFEAPRLAPKPSDIPIKIPLASVAKFCVSRCAVLKLVSRCSRIA